MVRISSHPEALRLFGLAIEEMGPQMLNPRDLVALDTWMEANRILLPPIPGPYRFENAPYLQEIAQAFTHEDFRIGVVLKGARVGYTEIINGAIGYIIDQDPGNILVYWPTQPDAVRWAKETLPDMIRTTPALHGKIADPENGRAKNTTILHRKFDRGWLTVAGSNSASAARALNGKYIFIDEFDVLDPRRNKKEGDFGARARRRALNDRTARILQGGSPQAINSRTVREYEASDQREYHGKCPHCGALQVLIWDQVRWDKTKDANGKVLVHHTKDAHYVCIECGAVIHEGPEKEQFLRYDPKNGARWIAKYPGRDVWGWKIPTILSLMAEWGVLASEYVTAVDTLKREGDPDLLIEWKQQVMAEPFEHRTSAGETKPLTERREIYVAEVPAGVGILVAAIDKQDDRWEVLIRGFGVGQEAWDIAHYRVFGDPDSVELSDRVAALLWRPFRHESGATLFVRAVGADSGDEPEAIYRFARKYARFNVWALKGVRMKKGDPLVVRSKSQSKNRLFLLDDHRLKRKVLQRLRIQEFGPGYAHFPMAQEDGGLGDDYLKQFENEREVPDGKNPDGSFRFKWQTTGANEAIDLAKMALAVLHILGDAVMLNLPLLVRNAQEAGEVVRKSEVALPAPVHPELQTVKRRRMGRGGGIQV